MVTGGDDVEVDIKVADLDIGDYDALALPDGVINPACYPLKRRRYLEQKPREYLN